MEIHPLCLLLPALNAEAYQVLLEDIRVHGQREPIKVWHGQLIDGRMRQRACEELGKPIQLEELGEKLAEEDLPDYVLSQNVVRRSLTKGQRAIIAARLLPEYETPAQQRRLATLVQYADSQRADERERGRAADYVARICQVNVDYVYKAARLMEEAPDLAVQVEAGTWTIPHAIARLEARTKVVAKCGGPQALGHNRRKKKPGPASDDEERWRLPRLTHDGGLDLLAALERLEQHLVAGSAADPEEVVETLLRQRPDETAWKVVQVMKTVILTIDSGYRARTGMTIDAEVVRQEEPEPAVLVLSAEEPALDLLAQVVRLGQAIKEGRTEAPDAMVKRLVGHLPDVTWWMATEELCRYLLKVVQSMRAHASAVSDAGAS